MKATKTNYVICVRAEESEDIEVRKVYEVLPDESAAKRGYLRVVDESGEDYLYPKDCFASVELPGEVVRAFTARPGRANKLRIVAARGTKRRKNRKVSGRGKIRG